MRLSGRGGRLGIDSKAGISQPKATRMLTLGKRAWFHFVKL